MLVLAPCAPGSSKFESKLAYCTDSQCSPPMTDQRDYVATGLVELSYSWHLPPCHLIYTTLRSRSWWPGPVTASNVGDIFDEQWSSRITPTINFMKLLDHERLSEIIRIAYMCVTTSSSVTSISSFLSDTWLHLPIKEDNDVDIKGILFAIHSHSSVRMVLLYDVGGHSWTSHTHVW